MSTKETGGPAFPVDYFYDQDTDKEVLPNEGMTLRDYFAAKAMTAIAITRQAMNNKTECGYIAAHAYLMADAMLEARK